MDFSIKQILPHVYHLDFGTQYDLAMHFLRAQEYYESPEFHKRAFTLIDFMDWYARTHGEGAFTYTKDWEGFNVPSWALLGVYGTGEPVPDPNRYDAFMERLVNRVAFEEKGHPFYFIGTFVGGQVDKHGEEDDVLSHELAHALFTVNSDYHEEVVRLLDEFRYGEDHAGEEYDSAFDVLTKMGYHASTIPDEIHAYSATGLCKELEGVLSESEMRPFRELFEEYRSWSGPLK